MQSLPEVQSGFELTVPRSGAGTVARPGLAGAPLTAGATETRTPLRQPGCSQLESHRGLKHEGILCTQQ